MVRSRKPLLMVPLHNTATTVPLLSTYTIQHGCAAFDNIPEPQWKASTASHIDGRANEQTIEQIYPPPNPKGDCSRSIRSLAVLLTAVILPGSLDITVWFSLSPLNRMVTLREGLVTRA
jgi:hypothetical protein